MWKSQAAIRKIAYVVHLRTRLRWTYRRTLTDVATRPWRTPRFTCRRSRAVERPGVCQRSINGCHAVASSGCLWRCLSRSASKNSRNVLYCAAIASLIARNSFVASVSIVDSFHFMWGAYFRRKSPLRSVAYVGGCCHPPLADSASCVPPVPGRRAPGSMEKIQNQTERFATANALIFSPSSRTDSPLAKCR